MTWDWKMVVRVPNRGSVRFLNLIIHYVNGDIFGTEERWSVFRDGPRCEASDTGSPLYKQLNCLVHLDTFVFMLLHKTTDIVIQII